MAFPSVSFYTNAYFLHRLLHASVFVFLTALSASAQLCQLQSLGTLPGGQNSVAFAVNNRGQIVGYSNTAPPSSAPHAVKFGDAGPVDLGTLEGGTFSYALGINNRGQIVGNSGTSSGRAHAFLLTGGVMKDLGTLPGGGSSSATAINDNGQIVGYATAASNETHAVLYQQGVMSDLGTLPGGDFSEATGINNLGQIVGYSTSNAGVHAFVYFNEAMIDIGTLGGNLSNATGINGAGQIVGLSTPLSNSPALAFLYSDGSMNALGTLTSGSFQYSKAAGINSYADIVGESSVASGVTHAFIWRGGVMTDLGTLPGSTYSTAVAINDQGLVVGSSTIANPTRTTAVVCRPALRQGKIPADSPSLSRNRIQRQQGPGSSPAR